MVAFSSMTGYAKLTAAIIAEIRDINPRAYIVWGGIHPIIVPEDAILHADAICTGVKASSHFRSSTEKFVAGQDYSTVRNFWFRQGDQVIRNGFLPLMDATPRWTIFRCRTMAAVSLSIAEGAATSP